LICRLFVSNAYRIFFKKHHKRQRSVSKDFAKYLVVLAEGGVELFHVRELVAGAALRAGAQRGDSKLLVLLSSNREVRRWNKIYPCILHTLE
jgi:hypothetical protein